MTDPLLSVEGLTVRFNTPRGSILANNSLTFALAAGETLGVVGESGSGKSVLCKALMRLVRSPPATVTATTLRFAEHDLLSLDAAAMRRLRGQDIGMVFQNPMTSLNPVWPIADQITEGLRVHKGMSGRDARAAAVALLRRVGIPSPDIRAGDYPHQWSGGMVQRAVIAMAMAGKPRLLLADEPTTALDVTIQEQILSLLVELQRETGMAMILISHDMSVISETCDRVAVMYAGSILETGPTADVFAAPAHPYTAALLRSIPHLSTASERLATIAGQPPDLLALPPGCPFAPRCPVASPECSQWPIALAPAGMDRATACHFPERVPVLEHEPAS